MQGEIVLNQSAGVAMSQTVSSSNSSDELARLRAQLARSEARLVEAQRIAQLGYWERDLTGGGVWWSDAFRGILGLDSDTPTAKFENALAFVHPADRPLIDQVYKNTIDSGEPFEFQCRVLLPPDAKERIVLVKGDAIKGADGAVTRLMGTAQDITARKRLEHALFESEARCKNIFERAPVGIVVVGPEERCTTTNSAWARMTGYGAEELAQMTWLELTHPDDRAESLRIVASADAGNLDEFVLDKRYVRRNGEVFWARTVGAVLRDETGAVMGRIAIIEDISEKKGAELRRAEHRRLQRDALVREVHHRIKNHLQGVAGLLERHAAANPALEPAIEEVLGQLSVLATVHGLQSELPGRELNLCNIARGIVETLQVVSTVPLEVALPEGFVPIEVNADEAVPIALILNELISNAVKHLAPSVKPAAVTIEMKRDGVRAVIVVRNAPASLPPGFDFANSRSLGTGLRLAKSLLPGEGARLTFSRPAPGVVESVLELWPPVLNHAVNRVSEAWLR